MTVQLATRLYLKTFFLISLFTMVAACGGGSSKSSSPVSNNSSSISASSLATSSSSSSVLAPAAQILFPPPVSLTEGNTVLVRGTATNTNNITNVKINGITATTTDNYATWQANVPLITGVNTLAVSINNTQSNAVVSKITSTARMHRPVSVAIDNANNRALVIDDSLHGVIAIDLTNGIRKTLSNNGNNLRDIDLLTQPDGIVVDSAHNRALVTDNILHSVIAVDLTSGAHTKFAYGFGTLAGIAIDTTHNRALVVDDSFNEPAIIALDLTNGARTILSNNLTPNADNRLYSVKSIALDVLNNRALVLDYYRDAIVAINLNSGVRTTLSNNTTPNAENAFSTPSSITLDEANNRALVMDGDNVLAINLSTGARTIFSNNSTLKNIAIPSTPSTTIAIDNNRKRALVASRDLHAIVAIDLASGIRTIFSGYHIPNEDNIFTTPKGIAFDDTNNRLLITDTSYPATLFSIDVNTSIRTVTSNNLIPNGINNLQYPEDVALDIAHNRALVIDSTIQAIISVDLNNGTRTVISSNTLPNSTNAFSRPIAIAFDNVRNNALVVDANLKAVIAVNLTTGGRTVLSSNTIPNNTNAFAHPTDIAFDNTHSRALVTDTNLDAVIAIDLITGARTVLSDNLTPKNVNPQFDEPYYIALDNIHNRALVANFNNSEIIGVDLTNGTRTIISGYLIPDNINYGLTMQSIAVDPIRNIAWTIYGGSFGQGLIAVDLLTGARVYISR